MNLVNVSRSLLETIPGLNNAIDAIIARVGVVFGAQHDNASGAHTNVTATTLALAAPASETSGNITGDLIPSADATYSLGQQGATTGTIRGWKNLFLETALYLGKTVGGAGSDVAQWAVTIGATITATAQQSTTQTWQWVTSGATTLFTIGGSTATGPIAGDGATANAAFRMAGAAEAVSGLYERGRAALMGEYTAVTFAAGNFTASGGGTWTLTSGDQTVFRWRIIGKSLLVNYQFDTTSVNAATSFLQVQIPGGFTAAQPTQQRVASCNDNGALADAVAAVGAAGGVILFFLASGSNWANSANLTYVHGTLEFEVQ